MLILSRFLNYRFSCYRSVAKIYGANYFNFKLGSDDKCHIWLSQCIIRIRISRSINYNKKKLFSIKQKEFVWLIGIMMCSIEVKSVCSLIDSDRNSRRFRYKSSVEWLFPRLERCHEFMRQSCFNKLWSTVTELSWIRSSCRLLKFRFLINKWTLS